MSDFIRGKVSGSGRVVLPAEFRAALGIKDGEEVVFSRNEFGIQITPLDHAIRQAQAVVSRYIPAEVNLVEELRQTRRTDQTFD